MRWWLWGIFGTIALALLGTWAVFIYSRGPDTLAGIETIGTSPKLLPPHAQIIPTIDVASAVGWAPGRAPTAPAGFAVTRFAEGLNHPRWLYVLPDGDILVAESSTRPSKASGIAAFVQNRMQKDAGASGLSADRITLLRDADGDGVAELSSVLLQNLNQPFGMSLSGGDLLVANTDELLVFPFRPGETTIKAPGRRILALPHLEPDNGHWTRNVVLNPDGKKLYVSVGSSSNAGERGPSAEERRADVIELSPDGSNERIFASGLRNPVGMAFEPKTHALWVTVNERDMLGDDLVPDYLTRLIPNGFYGWPYSYWGDHLDPRIAPKDQRPDLVARAIKPDYALGAHTASLGLLFYDAATFPDHYQGGAFIAQHGSWNRREHVGYKVVYLPFVDGHPAGPLEDFLVGFLDQDGNAQGRPVGLAVDRTGALLVADDVGGVVWRVTASR